MWKAAFAHPPLTPGENVHNRIRGSHDAASAFSDALALHLACLRLACLHRDIHLGIHRYARLGNRHRRTRGIPARPASVGLNARGACTIQSGHARTRPNRDLGPIRKPKANRASSSHSSDNTRTNTGTLPGQRKCIRERAVTRPTHTAECKPTARQVLERAQRRYSPRMRAEQTSTAVLVAQVVADAIRQVLVLVPLALRARRSSCRPWAVAPRAWAPSLVRARWSCSATRKLRMS